MTEDRISVESVEELQEEYARQRLLLWELLLKNQELRVQLATQRDCPEERHSR
jgi:hypothetical protein